MTTKAERMTHWRLSRQLFKPEEESGAHATSAMQLRSPPPTTSLASPARSPGSLSILQEWHSPAALEEVFPWWTESERGGDSAASPVPVSSSSFPSPRTPTVVASAPPTASDALAASEARRAGPFHARVAVRVRPRPSSDARSTPAADATAVSFEPAARPSAASVEGGAGARVFLRASRWDADASDADAAFAPDASQRRVFEEVALDATRAALSGRRGVVIALGAAGGGKSHTLFGPTTTEAVAEGGVGLLRDDPTSDRFDSTSDRLVDSGADRGVVIRALETIFAAAEELEASCGGEGVGECDGEGVGPSSTISARMTFVRVFRDGARDLFATGPARAFASPDVYPHTCDRAGRDATAVDRLSARVASDLAGARAVSIPARSLPEAAAAIRDALRRRDALDRLEGDPGDVEGRRSHALLRVTIERTTTTEVRSNASENEPNASEGPSVSAALLDWFAPDYAALGGGGFDVILACDVLYTPEAVDHVARLALGLMGGGGGGEAGEGGGEGREEGGVASATFLLADPPGRFPRNHARFVARMKDPGSLRQEEEEEEEGGDGGEGGEGGAGIRARREVTRVEVREERTRTCVNLAGEAMEVELKTYVVA